MFRRALFSAVFHCGFRRCSAPVEYLAAGGNATVLKVMYEYICLADWPARDAVYILRDELYKCFLEGEWSADRQIYLCE